MFSTVDGGMAGSEDRYRKPWLWKAERILEAHDSRVEREEEVSGDISINLKTVSIVHMAVKAGPSTGMESSGIVVAPLAPLTLLIVVMARKQMLRGREYERVVRLRREGTLILQVANANRLIGNLMRIGSIYI